MYETLTDRARKAILLAKQDAIKREDGKIRPGHVIIGILKCGETVATSILKKLNINSNTLLHVSEEILTDNKHAYTENGPSHSISTNTALDRAKNGSKNLGHKYIGIEHILLEILETDEGKYIANKVNFTYKDYFMQLVVLEKETRQDILDGRYDDHPIGKLESFLHNVPAVEDEYEDEYEDEDEDIAQAVYRLVQENRELRLILRGIRDYALSTQDAGDYIKWVNQKLQNHPLLEDDAEEY